MAGNHRYRYTYNGKELQDDNGMYDYGWRQYMPDIGRWNGIDQLAELYMSHTSYAYVMNNPVRYIDPDGRYTSQIQGLRDSMPNIYSGWEYIDGVNLGDWNRYPQQFSSMINHFSSSGGGSGGGGQRVKWGLGGFSYISHWTGGSTGHGYMDLGTAHWKFVSAWDNVVSFFKNHFVFELEGKGTLGVQGGFKRKFGTTEAVIEAGIFTGDIGKFGVSTKKGLFAEYGDGKGHNFIGGGLGIKKVSIGGKVDYVTNDWVPPAGDLLDYYPNNGSWDIEGNIGPRVNKGGIPNDGLFGPTSTIDAKIKQRARGGTTDACSGCVDMTFGMKAILGIELRVRTGFTGF